MAYIPEQNAILLEIAKSGSRSLFAAACELSGTDNPPAKGHHNIKTAIDRARCENPTVYALIRDPAERLLSAISFHFSRKDHTLDSAMNLLMKNGVTFNHAFATQKSFLYSEGAPHTLRLYRLEDIGELMKAIGHKGVPHKNKRVHIWPDEDVMSHPLFADALAAYECDQELRKRTWQKPQSASGQAKPSASRSQGKQQRTRTQPTQQTPQAAE